MELLNIGIEASFSASVDFPSARKDWRFSRLEKNHPDCLPGIIAANALVLDDGESGNKSFPIERCVNPNRSSAASALP